MSFRAYADNVVIQLEPQPAMSAGGLHIPQQTQRGARGSRTARVLVSGPGYYRQTSNGAGGSRDSVFVANEIKSGDRVLVDAVSGQDYQMDLTIPRHNKSTEFQELFGERGEIRIVREQEILGILEDD